MRIFYFSKKKNSLGKKTKIFFNTKITKSDYISKTKKRTKKYIYVKMSVRSNPIYPANLATFEEGWIFGFPKLPFLDDRGARTRYDVIWKFTTINFFCSSWIFYFKMATSEAGRGGGLHIRSWDWAKDVFLSLGLIGHFPSWRFSFMGFSHAETFRFHTLPT